MVSGDNIFTEHMAVGLFPEILDSVDVIMLVSKQVEVVDAEVLDLRLVDALEGVGIYDGACGVLSEGAGKSRGGPDFRAQDWDERV